MPFKYVHIMDAPWLTHKRVLRHAVTEQDVQTIDHAAHLGCGGQGLVNEGEWELVKHRGLAPIFVLVFQICLCCQILSSMPEKQVVLVSIEKHIAFAF